MERRRSSVNQEEDHPNKVMCQGLYPHAVETKFPPKETFLTSGSACKAELALLDRHWDLRNSEITRYLLCIYANMTPIPSQGHTEVVVSHFIW